MHDCQLSVHHKPSGIFVRSHWHFQRLLCTLFIVLLSGIVHAGNTAVTIYVDRDYKPYSYEEGGAAKGLYVDVLKAAFKRMPGFDVSIKPVPWQRGKQLMASGEGFALAPVFYHGHDWPYLHPYSLPFYTETVWAVCNAEVMNSPRNNWPNDFEGLRFSNVAGFDGWGGPEFRAMVKAGRIGYEESNGASTNIMKLGAGRVDCILMEEWAFDAEMIRLRDTGRYSDNMTIPVKATVAGADPVYLGYSKPSREKNAHPFQFDFMHAFDNAIYQMQKSGEIERIVQRPPP